MAPTVPIDYSEQRVILAVSTICIVIPSVLIGLRALAKMRARGKLDASDYCILAALLFNNGQQVLSWVLVFKGGFGLHTADIVQRFGMETLTIFYKCLFAFPLVWNITIPLSKISVLLMYLSIIPFDRMRLAVWLTGGFIVAFNVGSFFAGLAICSPIAYNWDQTIPGGHCGSQQNYYYAMGFINLVVDLAIIAIPMPFLYKLLLPTPKKLLAMGMFGVGIGTIAITIYRQIVLEHTDFLDMPYSGAAATLLSGVEPAVAIAMACIPLMGPLFRRRTKQSGGENANNPRTRTSRSHITASQKGLGTDVHVGSFEQLDDTGSEVRLQSLDSKRL